MSKKDIELRILAKFPSLAKFAQAIGVDRSQITRWLQKPNNKFLAALQKEGISIDGIDIDGLEDEGRFIQKKVTHSIAGKFQGAKDITLTDSYAGLSIELLQDMVELLKSDKKKLEERVAELEKEIKELRVNR